MRRARTVDSPGFLTPMTKIGVRTANSEAVRFLHSRPDLLRRSGILDTAFETRGIDPDLAGVAHKRFVGKLDRIA